MSYTLTNIQNNEAISLLQPIENKCKNLVVGLESITYTVGWYNITEAQGFSSRNTNSTTIDAIGINPGLYSFTMTKEIIETGVSNTQLEANRVDGLATLTVSENWEVLLTDGIVNLLGLGVSSGQWIPSGVYTGIKSVDFSATKNLYVHLDQISNSENFLNGNPSNLLTTIGIGSHSFGDINTVRVEHPEFKRLQCGTINELKVTIRDNNNQIINNNNLQICCTLEIK